jgi:hypothetical protein
MKTRITETEHVKHRLGQLYVLTPMKMVVPENDFDKWSHWYMTSPDRIVGQTLVPPLFISTVFTGMDYSMDDRGEPVVFETKAVDKEEHVLVDWKTVLAAAPSLSFRPTLSPEEIFMVRYDRYGAALAGHKRIVEALRK